MGVRGLFSLPSSLRSELVNRPPPKKVKEPKGKESDRIAEGGTEHMLIARIQELEDALAYSAAASLMYDRMVFDVQQQSNAAVLEAFKAIEKEEDPDNRRVLAKTARQNVRTLNDVSLSWRKLLLAKINEPTDFGLQNSAYDYEETRELPQPLRLFAKLEGVSNLDADDPPYLRKPIAPVFSNEPVTYPGEPAAVNSSLFKRRSPNNALQSADERPTPRINT